MKKKQVIKPEAEKEEKEEGKSVLRGGLIGAVIFTALFSILKVYGVIDWSWIWITFPIWGDFALVILFAIFVAIKED